MRPVRIAILISGRGSNMEAIVRAVREGVLLGRAHVVAVVSDRPGAAGLRKAQGLGVATALVSALGVDREGYDQRLLAFLEPLEIDYIVLAGFMRVLGPALVARYRDRIVNIHPADTQQHQGLHGYAWAFERRLEETRITVHLVDEGLDTGTILAQRTVDLRGARTLEEVERGGLAVEHAFYSQVLAELFSRSE